MSLSPDGIVRPSPRGFEISGRLFRRYKKKNIAAAIKARPATPPTTPPAMAPTFGDPVVPEGVAVGDPFSPGMLTVTVVVIIPLVDVKGDCDNVVGSLPGARLAIISPVADFAAHPMKYAPYNNGS